MLKLHYDQDNPPEDQNTFSKYASHFCKRYLFSLNLTEDVFDCSPISCLWSDERCVWKLACTTVWNTFFHAVFFNCFQGSLLKVSECSKSVTICQVLTGILFLSFQHLLPEFQKYIMLRIHIIRKKGKTICSYFLYVD